LLTVWVVLIMGAIVWFRELEGWAAERTLRDTFHFRVCSTICGLFSGVFVMFHAVVLTA